MKRRRFRLTLMVGILTLVLLVPATALGYGFVVQRGLIGLSVGPPDTFMQPDLSGNNVIYARRGNAVGSKWYIYRFNLATGGGALVQSDAAYDLYEPAIDGDWITWNRNSDIRAKNIKTGATKAITNDGLTTIEAQAQVSGKYVVWWSMSAPGKVMGKNLTNSNPPFQIGGGSGQQILPSVYGKRVAYMDDSNGHWNIYVKTIGSSAAPMKITDNTVEQQYPSIGDHLVAWQAKNGSGKWMVRYFDFNTGETYDGPSSTTQDIFNPQVSGDRILYSMSNGSDQDLFVWDTRVQKTAGILSFFVMSNDAVNETSGQIAGNELVFTHEDKPVWARLAAPSISLKSTPKRIANGARLRLKGSISDQGHRIGYASLGIERYKSGKWSRIKTITASSSGTFNYRTPKNYSKRDYRVVYDGRTSFFDPLVKRHLSTVSKTKTAWPY